MKIRVKKRRRTILPYLIVFIVLLVLLQLLFVTKFPSAFSRYHFNKVPLEKRYGEIRSHSHCIGDNYRNNSWEHKTCRIQNLCYNGTDWVVFRTSTEWALEKKFLSQNPYMHDSTLLNQSVSIGGINLKWGQEGVERMKWSPRIIDDARPRDYYSFSAPLVLYHSMNGANPGHLVWDDFLPIYTLMKLFQVEGPILPMRYVLNDGKRGLWASCDFRDEKKELCRKMINKFLPLLVGLSYPYRYSSTDEIITNVPEPDALICAETALVGIGDLTDHGTMKSHGWEDRDYNTYHNHGRQLYEFRNFMVSNLGLPIEPKRTKKVIFSQGSSDIPQRNMNFEKQIDFLRQLKVDVHPVVMKTLSVKEQVELVHDAAVYITLCGGGAVDAIWMPKGSTVILYYAERGGVEDNHFTGKSSLLDWDLMNSLSYLHVHWMPINSMDNDLNTLALLIQTELSNQS